MNDNRQFTTSRRSLVKGGAAVAGAVAGGVPIAPSIRAQDEELPQGGTLRAAIVSEPPAVMDAMFSTATVTNNVCAQVFEGLFTFDQKFNAKPMLVEDYEQSSDGLKYTFRLRSGIKFHDGSDMKAADVVASLNRWGKINGRGKRMYARMDAIEATDDTTVTMTFKQPTGVLLSFLARTEAFVLPASIADAAGENQLGEDQFIGTGPFKFVEQAVDQYIRVERFDDYQAREEAPDGMSGKRTAYLDAIEFVPVPDESVRANGVIAGDYHFGDPMPPDFYDQLTNDPSLQGLVVQPYYWYAPVFNKKEGLFKDVKARQAVLMMINPQDVLIAGFGREELVRADPSICGEETAWYSNAGTEPYGTTDPDKAKALLGEAGYKGETIRWLTTHDYAYNYKIADYMKQQLESIGAKVELVVSDWATLLQDRADSTKYEIFLTGFSQYAHPATQPFNDDAWPGFWDSKEKDSVLDQMVAAADDKELKASIDAYTELIYKEVPIAKVGDNFVLRGLRSEVKGYQNAPDWYFWNVGLEG